MNKMVATTLESNLIVYDLRTHHPIKGFSSLSEKVRFAHSFLLTTSHRPTTIPPYGAPSTSLKTETYS